jgi:hypothetical protein
VGEFVAAGCLDFFFEGLSRALAAFELLHEGGLQGFAIFEQGYDFVTGLDEEWLQGFCLGAFW